MDDYASGVAIAVVEDAKRIRNRIVRPIVLIRIRCIHQGLNELRVGHTRWRRDEGQIP